LDASKVAARDADISTSDVLRVMQVFFAYG
jgi:hypothetical protein